MKSDPAPHVLVVDDEPAVAKLIEELLHSENYRVTVFNDSVSALEYFREHPSEVDLVITDQTMPKITGSELSQTMLKIRPDLPIVICTGYSNSIDSQTARELGIKAFFNKPLDLALFLDTIGRLLIQSQPE